ncbi:MAG: TonB-dependent receptor [Pseudomonadota bacterium]
MPKMPAAMGCAHRCARALRPTIAFAMGAFASSIAAHAQGNPSTEPPAPAAAAASTAATRTTQLAPVEVKALRDDLRERRESTAAKIVIGREEIERYGDSNLGDVLKRLPGVTMQGRPGRGGNIRMRGLGSGYTQILLDGQRIPPGFSLDSLTPEQIERIEILRAPTAETGARAIAGTINIITREGFNKHINDVRLTLGVENDRVQPSVSWTRNEPIGPFIVNHSMSAFSSDRESGSTTTTVDRRLADDSITLDQRDVGRVRDKRQGVHATGRLQWRSEQGVDSVILMPLLIYGRGTTQREGVLTQTVGAQPKPYDTSATDGDGSFTLLRLNGQWNHRLDAGGRLESKFGFGQGRNRTNSLRNESTGGALSRTLEDRGDTRDRNALLSGKFMRTLAGEHSLVAGAEGEANRRTETRNTNDPTLLANFGDNVAAASTRFAAYAQDEWQLSPQWAAHAGLRWEGIATRGASGENGTTGQTNRSSVWTPLMHAVWKPEPESRDQVRFSLTRSYRSPTLQNLIGRPSINNRYPAPGANTPTHPDRAGNPDLKPELATGLDIAVERYLAGGGLLSANVFHRQIRNYMRSQTALEVVAWSPAQPRYVSRPQNRGDAMTQGLELEAKFRTSELIAGAPKVDLRTNASVFRSRVKAVPGPDNRLDQQPGVTANLGADYRVPGWPLTLGGNLNWTPAYDTRVGDIQTARQGRKVVIDAYGLWVFNPSLQLRLTASNLNPRDYLTGGSVDDLGAGLRETSSTTAPTFLNVQLRLEMKL